MATGTGDDDGEARGKGGDSKLAKTVSSSSSTVSTSSYAAEAAVSEASSSASLPLLRPLSAVPSAAVITAAVDSLCKLVVAWPAAVALHDLSTLKATSTSDARRTPPRP